MTSQDTDSRTALARYELAGADAGAHGAVLAEVRRSLEGMDDRTRRKGLLLVSAVALQWALWLKPGPEDKLRIEFEEPSRDGLRIVLSGEKLLPLVFWEVVGGAAATAFADAWEIARDGSRAWFEIWRSVA